MTKQESSKNSNKGAITRSTNKKATARRLRDEMIFWEEMAKIHREAKLASILSYFLEMASNLESL